MNRVGKLGRLAGARLFCGLEFGMLNAAVEVCDTPLGDRGGMGGNWESVDDTCASDIPHTPSDLGNCGEQHMFLTHDVVRGRCKVLSAFVVWPTHQLVVVSS